MAPVRNVDTSKSRQAIARGVLRLCQGLGIQGIAEGVESAAKRDFFVSEGVEDRKFKRPFSRPLPPRQGSWPHLLWTWESASVLESVDSAAQTRPSWGSPPGEPWQALVDGQRHLRKDQVPDRRARRHQQRSPRQQARTDLGQPSRQHGRRTPCQTRCTSRRCAVPSARKTCKAWLGMPSGNESPTATRSSPVLASTVLSVPTSLA